MLKLFTNNWYYFQDIIQSILKEVIMKNKRTERYIMIIYSNNVIKIRFIIILIRYITFLIYRHRYRMHLSNPIFLVVWSLLCTIFTNKRCLGR